MKDNGGRPFLASESVLWWADSNDISLKHTETEFRVVQKGKTGSGCNELVTGLENENGCHKGNETEFQTCPNNDRAYKYKTKSRKK